MADKLPETMSQEDPWAWQEWAAQRDPGTYGWRGRAATLGSPEVGGDAYQTALKDALVKAGIYDPSYQGTWDAREDGSTYTPPAGPNPYEGYTLQEARGPGYQHLYRLLDPNGQELWRKNESFTDSFHSDTYRKAAGMAAAVLGGGYAISSLAGAGAAATGATGATGGAAAVPAAGTNWGAIGSAAAKSAALNGGLTAVRGGDLGDVLKSAAVGGVTGAAGGAISSLGYSPVVSQAATGAIGAAARGGSGTDILTGAGVGALSGYVAGNGITGNSTVDRAITGAGTTAIRGGNASQIAQGAAGGALSDLTSGSRTSQTPAGPTYDVDLETPGINDNPGAAMSDPFDLSYGAVNDDLTFSTDVTGPNINDFPEDPGDGSFNPYDDPSRRADTVSNNGGNREPSGGWDFSKIFGSLFGNSPGQYSGGAFVSDMLKLFGAGMAGVSSEKAQQDQRDWLERQAAEQRRRRMPGALAPMNVTVQRGGVNA